MHAGALVADFGRKVAKLKPPYPALRMWASAKWPEEQGIGAYRRRARYREGLHARSISSSSIGVVENRRGSLRS
jgi:hypothetical protein